MEEYYALATKKQSGHLSVIQLPLPPPTTSIFPFSHLFFLPSFCPSKGVPEMIQYPKDKFFFAPSWTKREFNKRKESLKRVHEFCLQYPLFLKLHHCSRTTALHLRTVIYPRTCLFSFSFSYPPQYFGQY